MLAEDSKLLESLLQFKNIVCDTAALDQPTAPDRHNAIDPGAEF